MDSNGCCLEYVLKRPKNPLGSSHLSRSWSSLFIQLPSLCAGNKEDVEQQNPSRPRLRASCGHCWKSNALWQRNPRRRSGNVKWGGGGGGAGVRALKIDTWPCNDFQFNVVTCVPCSPLSSQLAAKSLWHKWASQARTFQYLLGQWTHPQLRCTAPAACIWFQQTCKAALDPIFLTFSLLMSSSPSALLLSLFLLVASPSPFLWHLLCGSDYALHLSVLSCFRFLCQRWKLEFSCALAVWISASGMSSLMTGFIWMRE